MTPHITRRTLLLGSAATGALAWAGTSAVPAFADALVYDSPEAFDAAQAASLATNPTNNEVGLYAWGESYFMLGLLRMYEAYQDLKYLQTFEQRATHLLATTDKARVVTDYRGRSGTVWRSAGNYTAGHGVLRDGNGTPAVQLRWSGARSAESTADVSNVSGSTFDLVLRNPGIAGVVTLRGSLSIRRRRRTSSPRSTTLTPQRCGGPPSTSGTRPSLRRLLPQRRSRSSLSTTCSLCTPE